MTPYVALVAASGDGGGGSGSVQDQGTVTTVRGASSSMLTWRAEGSPPTTMPAAPAGIHTVWLLARGARKRTRAPKVIEPGRAGVDAGPRGRQSRWRSVAQPTPPL